MNILLLCLKTILVLAISSFSLADTTGDVREFLSIAQLKGKGGSVKKVAIKNSHLFTVSVELVELSECTVDTFDLITYGNGSKRLAIVPIGGVDGNYKFYASHSLLSNLALSIACVDDGFFSILEIPLKDL